jgi:hypothetical protein
MLLSVHCGFPCFPSFSTADHHSKHDVSSVSTPRCCSMSFFQKPSTNANTSADHLCLLKNMCDHPTSSNQVFRRTTFFANWDMGPFFDSWDLLFRSYFLDLLNSNCLKFWIFLTHSSTCIFSDSAFAVRLLKRRPTPAGWRVAPNLESSEVGGHRSWAALCYIGAYWSQGMPGSSWNNN